MKLVLLGSGSPGGWPDPTCGCGSCTAARAAGALRGSTSALLDDMLLLDAGPDTASAVQRAGRDLTRLAHVLLTPTDPGAAGAALDLVTSWPGSGLDVVGSPDLLVGLADRLPDGSRVRLVPLRPGERTTLGGYDVAALPTPAGASALVYDVTGPSGRLVHAPATGPLSDASVEALRGAALDVLLLDESGGRADTASGAPAGHLDLTSFPEQLRRLRDVQAVTAHTDVVAVHLSHANPPPEELAALVAAHGARVVADGTLVGAGPDRTTGRTLVLGGTRSGKSREAERLLAGERDVTYVATAYPASLDDEWSERVRLHRERRPAHWRTTETLDLVPLLDDQGGPLLVDCLTLWLTRVMDRHDAWDDGTWARSAQQAVAEEVERLLVAWRATTRRVVAVSNEVGQGVVPESAAGRRFRDLMGQLNARVAAETEDVRWCVAGRVLVL